MKVRGLEAQASPPPLVQRMPQRPPVLLGSRVLLGSLPASLWLEFSPSLSVGPPGNLGMEKGLASLILS